jgi:hypothetical protein
VSGSMLALYTIYTRSADAIAIAIPQYCAVDATTCPRSREKETLKGGLRCESRCRAAGRNRFLAQSAHAIKEELRIYKCIDMWYVQI